MVGIGQFAFNLITTLVMGVLQEGVNYKVLQFFERRRIDRRIEDAIAEVVEPLLPFLAQEKIPEDKQRRLIQTCVDELNPLTENPEQLFKGSLEGQKIFEELYADRDLPQVIIEDGLKDIYTLLCPRIATLLCKIPAAVKDWENEAWSENYRRLDEITAQVRKLFSVVDELSIAPSRQADETLLVVRRSLAQKIRLELDLTGLRADQPIAGEFEDFFVHPEIKEIAQDEEKLVRVAGKPDESFKLFTQPNHQEVLVGLAGAGKSTWTKWLLRETLTNRWVGIGIRIELRRFANNPLLSLHEIIRETAGKHLAEDLTADRIGRWLDNKQVVFILDGFDEIRPESRDEVYDWITELKSAARGCPIVLTSRPLTTEHLNQLAATGWQEWMIEPFDEERIVDYIRRWYQFTPMLTDESRDINAHDLTASWRNDATIKPLTGNPLLLSTLLMVHLLDGRLPTGRSQLYRRYVEGMLGIWDDRRKVTATSLQLKKEEKWQILRGFALKLFFNEQDQMDETTAVEWLQEFLEEQNITLLPIDVLSLLRERSGLIVGPGIYSFAHKSIAEYLVAEAVLQGDQRDASGARIDRFSLFEHRGDDRWNTVTFLWAGLAPIADVEDFIEQCITAGKWDLAYGILDDQYDRLPTEIRRNFLLRQIPESVLSDSVIWAVPHSKNRSRPELGIPDIDLRSLQGRRSYSDFIRRPIVDGTIVWSDQINSTGKYRDAWWMNFCATIQDVDEWRECLSAPCPQSASSLDWLFWVAISVFSRTVHDKNLEIGSVVAAYQMACPQALGLIPIALMSVMLRIYGRRKYKPAHTPDRELTAYVQVLSNSNGGKILPEWLAGTDNWDHNFFKAENYRFTSDLLADYMSNMKKWVEAGYIEKNADYERAVEFVRELKERREAIDAES